MKRILLLAIAALWLAAPSSSQAQSVTKLCFPATGLTATRTSCIPVDNLNPLPTTATLSAAGGINVTVTNTTGSPAVVTCANCATASVSGNITIQNVGTPANVSEVNSAAIATKLDTINTSINSPGTVTVSNTALTIQNSNSSAPVFVQQTPGTTNGWTPLLLNGLTTTVTTVKNGTGKLAKLYCYNPNSSVAYVQVFSLTPTMVTLGTTTPTNSYGIGATSIGGFGSSVGDNYSNAMSVAATTTVKGLTAPSTALDCNVSFN